MTATLPLPRKSRSAPRHGSALPPFCSVPRDTQRGLALRAIAACAPALRSSRSARRRFASGSPHARLRPDARLLSRREPHPAPTDGSPFREWHRRLALAATRLCSLPSPLLPPPRHVFRASGLGAYCAFAVRALSQYRDVRRFDPALRTVARMGSIIPALIVSHLAKRRYAPPSPALHSPASRRNPPTPPCLRKMA